VQVNTKQRIIHTVSARSFTNYREGGIGTNKSVDITSKRQTTVL